MTVQLAWVFAIGLLVAAEGSNGAISSREALISAAIEEVKGDFAKPAEERQLTTAERRLKAFKKASTESLAQGMARLRFERMVKTAEHKILEKRREQLAASQTAEDKAESLALELFHKPGSILNSEEIAKMYSESECKSTLTRPPRCTATRFRTPSGVCNNLQNPTYGSADTPMRRLIPPRYDDGIGRLRGTLQIERSSIVPGPFSPPNPSPRVVSLGIIRDRPVNDSRFSHILMQWGQFMDHDLDFIPEFEPESCPKNCRVIEDSCVPFPVPQDDRKVQVTRGSPNSCHLFRRSLPACDTSTPQKMTAREQVNGISHFIDGSMIYHHNKTVFDTMIRNKNSPDGLLNVGPPAKGTNQPSLPVINSRHGPVICMDPPCFLAGDLRVNEQTALTVMHTVWVREHNRIARLLRANNRRMSSDNIFETARSIVIAEIQKITYKDYLPLLLGQEFSRLIPTYRGYNPNVFPNVPNAFATAAYRFGHSQIQPFFERLDKNYKSIPAGPLPLMDAFFNNSQFLENGGTDPILRGLLTTPAREVDEFLNTVITNMLFSNSSSSPGMDLASLNIQRGRDHGLPTYLTWKQWAKTECNLESNFRNQLTRIRLLQTYGSLNNVDLFVGGLAEEPVRGGVVGATFACIFAKTFIALRDGDRFYYENTASNSNTFTATQRAEIEKASLSRVICDNTDITHIQRNAFLVNQRRTSCLRLPSINLNAWKPSAVKVNSWNPVSLQSLPKYCYTVVRNDATKKVYVSVLSRLEGDTRYCSCSRHLEDDSFGCFVILCPTQKRGTELKVRTNPKTNMTIVPPLPINPSSFDIEKNALFDNYWDCRDHEFNGIILSVLSDGLAHTNSEEENELPYIGPETDVKFIDEDNLKELIPENTPSKDMKQDIKHINSIGNGQEYKVNSWNSVSLQSLPKYCYTVVRNDATQKVYVSVLSKLEGDTRYCSCSRHLEDDSFGCFVILCPTQKRGTELKVRTNPKTNVTIVPPLPINPSSFDIKKNALFVNYWACHNHEYNGISLDVLSDGLAHTSSEEENDLPYVGPETDVKFIDEDNLKELIPENTPSKDVKHINSIGNGQESKVNYWNPAIQSNQRYCYIGVRNNIPGSIVHVNVLSRLAGDTRYCSCSTYIEGNDYRCFVILCPTQSRETELIVKTNPETKQCIIYDKYNRTLNQNTVNDRIYGIFYNYWVCNSREYNGVILFKGSAHTNSAEEDELPYIGPETDVKYIDEDNLKELIPEKTSSNNAKYTSSIGKGQEDKLVRIMEETLLLNSFGDSSKNSEKNDKKAKRNKEKKSNTMKKLEDALSALEH